MSEGRKPKTDMYKVMTPILGLLLAVLLAAVAYGVSPLAVEGVGSIKQEWADKLYADDDPATPEREYDPNFRWLFMGIIWLSLMGLGMTIAAVAAGTDPAKESLKLMSAPPANRKAQIKQLKKDLKSAKKRSREKKKQAKQ